MHGFNGIPCNSKELKMIMSKQLLEGSSVSVNVPPALEGQSRVVLHGIQNGKRSSFEISDNILSKHILLVGGTGCGKTTLFYHFVSQLQGKMSSNDVMLIFDSKGDFYTRFYKGGQYVVGNSRQYRDKSLKWNIFKEILADGWNSVDYMLNSSEICRSLFEEKFHNTNNIFFPNAACQLLSAVLISVIREAEKNKSALQNMYNSELKALMEGCDAFMLQGIINTHPDMKSVSSYIAGKGGQSQGVMSELFSTVRELLVGVFAEKGGFSIRDFVRSKGKRVLYIEYDLSIGSVLTPIYRLLFDLALKEALGRSGNFGNVYLICDEFKLLPLLKHIEDGVNFGRSLGVKIIAGLQSIEQLYEIYDEKRGRNIAAGFSSVFAFKANDGTTRDYITNLFGKNMLLERYVSTDAQYIEEKRIGQVVEDWDMAGLQVGEAIVSLPFSKPFLFRFDMYH